MGRIIATVDVMNISESDFSKKLDALADTGASYLTLPSNRSVAIVRETRNGVRPISGAQNEATAMAFGGPRSSCVRPGAHSARHQDSHNDWTPCRMAWPFVSAGAHAPHSDETHGPTVTRGSSLSARRLRSLAFLCSSAE